MPASAFAKWGRGLQMRQRCQLATSRARGPKPYTDLSKYTKSPYDKPYGNPLNSVISHSY